MEFTRCAATRSFSEYPYPSTSFGMRENEEERIG